MLSDRTTGILFGVSVSCLGKSGVVGKQGGGQAGGQASGWPVGGLQAAGPVAGTAVAMRPAMCACPIGEMPDCCGYGLSDRERHG